MDNEKVELGLRFFFRENLKFLIKWQVGNLEFGEIQSKSHFFVF